MSNTLLMPGHRVCEYKLIVPLSEPLQQAVVRMRAALHDKYKIPFAADDKPCLTALHCYAYEGMEEKLAERIQQVVTRMPAFRVELEYFSAHSSTTIFIRVANRAPFYELSKELKVVKSLTKVPAHESTLVAEPHIDIAQKLKPFQFIRIWMDCEHQPFTGSFKVSDMLLLKRSLSTTTFALMQRFELAAQAVHARQGVLFA